MAPVPTAPVRSQFLHLLPWAGMEVPWDAEPGMAQGACQQLNLGCWGRDQSWSWIQRSAGAGTPQLLVTVGPVAPPGPGDFCSAAPVAPAGPTSSAPPWGKTLTPGSAVTAATPAPVRGAAGGTGSPGPRGHHSQLGSGDRRRAVTRGGKECGVGLLCSSSPCPSQCPPLKPSQTPAPRLRDPRAVPRLLALCLR